MSEVINEVEEVVEEVIEEIKPKKSFVQKVKENKIVVAVVGATVIIVGGLVYVATSGRFDPAETADEPAEEKPVEETAE